MVRQYFTAAVVCQVCRITQRKLDYWIATGVVIPTKVWQRHARDKATFVFTREEIGLLRLVAQFREAGLPLQRIRWTMRRIQNEGYPVQRGTYLVTDGESIFKLAQDPNVAVKLSRGEYGQLVLAAVALGPIWKEVMERLDRPNIRPISDRAMRECLRPWTKRVIGR